MLLVWKYELKSIDTNQSELKIKNLFLVNIYLFYILS